LKKESSVNKNGDLSSSELEDDDIKIKKEESKKLAQDDNTIFEITVESKWDDVNKFLSSNLLWKHSDQYDKLVAYEEFMRDITKVHDQKI
jgi:hypothetical protein